MSEAVLLDANVLIALVVADHVHHEPVERWLAHDRRRYATCPITEGSLVRLVVRESGRASEAVALLRALGGDERHEFWPDGLAYVEVPMRGVLGHRQVTDAYLAALARDRGGRLATLDGGLAALHRDVVELVPTEAGT